MNGRPDGRRKGAPSQLEDALARIAASAGNECVEWRGTPASLGYGQAWHKGKKHRAHRLIYSMLVGPIPEGLVLDHLCRNPPCVKPEHLEPVTIRENTLRGLSLSAQRAVQTHCKRGHPLSGDNVYLKGPSKRRNCRACAAIVRSTPAALARRRGRRARAQATT